LNLQPHVFTFAAKRKTEYLVDNKILGVMSNQTSDR